MYEIETHLAPSHEEQALLKSIQGIQAMSAAVIIVEIEVDMSIFPSDTLLASWSGMARCITRLNIPGAARKNSKGGSWVNGLPHVERSWGTVACRLPAGEDRRRLGCVPQGPRKRVRARLLPRLIPNRCMPTPTATASKSDVASWGELRCRHPTIRSTR
jgi:Transposase IS116/IS110/IS902 family